MNSDRIVKIDNVEVLQDTGLVLRCRIGARRIDIPKLMLRGIAPLPGQQGTLHLLEWFAAENDLND